MKDIAAYCSRHDWVWGANDPDLMGWLTVAAYLVVAALKSLWRARSSNS